MKTPESYSLTLQNGDVKLLAREPRRKLLISCKAGTVWVTATGDLNDYIVSAGGEFQIDEGKDSVLLQSLSDTLHLDIRLSA